ncbi:MAG: glycosyltransferase family 4 protein [Vicinamibacterales bacterium]
MTRVLLATNSRDRGSTSRTLEAWTGLLPAHGITPIVSLGGDGPLEDALRARGVEVHRQPIRVFFKAGEHRRFLQTIASLAMWLRRNRIQLVHVNEHEHYPVVGRAAYLARVPVVTHVRFRIDPPFAQWLFKSPYTPRRVFFTSETQMVDTAAAVATVVPADRFRLVYNGLDFESFGHLSHERERLRAQWNVSPSTIAIGTASSISSRKRLHHFIRLVGNLRRQGIDARGFIAGQPYFPEDEAELQSLQTLCRELGLQDRVTFLGYVEPAEPLYHAWDMTISASEYETFGMTMLEAMACGCPVVAYPGGSIAEVVGDGGIIVPDGDLAALTAEAGRLCQDDAYRHAQGALARGRARYFDVRRSVDQLAAEYLGVLDGVPRGKSVSAPSASVLASASASASGFAADAAAPEGPIKVLYLTMNPNRLSTTVPTEGWIRCLTPRGLRAVVASNEDGSFLAWLAEQGHPGFHIPMPVPNELSWQRLAGAIWRLRQLVIEYDIQIIHSNEQDLYPVAQYLARLCRLPVVVSVHFTMDREFSTWAFKGARLPARMFFVSEGNLEACRTGLSGVVPRARWRVLPNGLNLRHFTPDPQRRAEFRAAHNLESSLVIGVACALRPRKQLEHLFRAASELQVPNLRVVVAGEAVKGDEAYAEAMIRAGQSLLGDRLVILGHISELRGFYNGLDLFVNTSQEEACSISVLESLACGCPVVGYASRSVDGQILPDGGEIVAQDDVSALTGALDRWLAGPTRRAAARGGARRMAEERFDVDRMSEMLWDEYKAVLGIRTPPVPRATPPTGGQDMPLQEQP